MYETLYEKILDRLEEIREYDYQDGCILFAGEIGNQKGIRQGETTLQAIARHMVEVVKETV